VRTHTNLQFEHRLELYEAGMLPWDIEMTVEDPLSDDEGGVLHDGSDSDLIFGLQHYFYFHLPHFFVTFDLQDQCRQIAHVLH
jgi:hypothetical protein